MDSEVDGIVWADTGHHLGGQISYSLSCSPSPRDTRYSVNLYKLFNVAVFALTAFALR